jgi:hypothetical protein
MASFERHSDFTVSLEAAYTRAVPRARINDDKRPPLHVNVNTAGRDDPHECIAHWPLKRPPVGDELNLVLKNMRSSLGQMLAVMVPALPHDVPKEDVPLRSIDDEIHTRFEDAKR